MTDYNLPVEVLEKIVRTPALRQRIASESMRYFFGIYLNHYIQFDFAPFHNDFFSLAEDEQKKLVVILAFRGSGKSTYFTTCYPIWAITGKLKKKSVVIFTQTQQQAKRILENIKKELESNELLKADIGPFEDPKDEWSAMSIVLKNFKARITVASTEQSIRGIRFSQYRPDLIILDDIQDITSVKTKELRDKLASWFDSEVIPLGTLDVKIILVGTRLHEDDLCSRIINLIKQRKKKGIYRIYPIATASGRPNWPGKYPNKKAVEEEHRRIMDEAIWQKEYMQRIVYDEDYIYIPSDFMRYEVLPPASKIRFILIAIDLAISTKSSADKTGVIAAYIAGWDKETKAYIAPQFINKRMGFTETIEEIKRLRSQLVPGIPAYLLVENVAYQQAAIEQLELEGFTVYAVNPQGEDKRARLTVISPQVKKGSILFPKTGTEELEQQLVGFGIERYDDLADAFAYLANRVRQEKLIVEPNIYLI